MLLAIMGMLLGTTGVQAQERVPIEEALPSTAQYLAQLRSPEPEERAVAVMMLSLTGSGVPGVESALLASLDDPGPLIRGWAAMALATVAPKSEAVRKTLESRLRSDLDPTVRASCASALGEIAHSGSVAGLAQALSDTDVRTRLEAVGALAAIDASVVLKVIDTISKLEQDPDAEVRAAASSLVLKLKPKE